MNWDLTGIKTAMDEFGRFVPNLIAGLVLLLLGYIISRVLGRVTRTLLERARFDRLTTRLGLTKEPEANVAAYWLGRAVFLVGMLVTIMQVARTWNLTFVAVGFARLIAYVPHVIAAAVIIGVALYFGNWVRDRLARSRVLGEGEGAQLRFMPSIVRGGILAVGIFMALRELQIAPEIVNIAFMLMLGAIALATALAFGLGGREVAGRVAQSWYERRLRAPGPRDVAIAGPAETHP